MELTRWLHKWHDKNRIPHLRRVFIIYVVKYPISNHWITVLNFTVSKYIGEFSIQIWTCGSTRNEISQGIFNAESETLLLIVVRTEGLIIRISDVCTEKFKEIYRKINIRWRCRITWDCSVGALSVEVHASGLSFAHLGFVCGTFTGRIDGAIVLVEFLDHAREPAKVPTRVHTYYSFVCGRRKWWSSAFCFLVVVVVWKKNAIVFSGCSIYGIAELFGWCHWHEKNVQGKVLN